MTTPPPTHAAAVLRVYLITDRRLAPEGGLPSLVARALAQLPADQVQRSQVAVQLREKDLSARALLALARALRDITRAHGAALLVNDRVDVALASEADGVHLAGHSLPPEEARRLLGPGRLLGASAHSLDEARRARDGGCDFATFGPVYATPSKAPYGPPVGLGALRATAAALAPFPLIALGGVTPQTASACRAAGATGVAVIRAVLAAPDPARALRMLYEPDAPPPSEA